MLSSTLLVGRKLSKNLSCRHSVFLNADLSSLLNFVLTYVNRNFRHYSGSRALCFQTLSLLISDTSSVTVV